MEKLNEVWNLTPLLSGDEDPSINDKRKVIEHKYKEFANKWKDNSFISSPEKLKEALDEYEHLVKFYGGGGEESFYFELRSCQEQDNPKIKSKVNKIVEFTQKLGDEIRFFKLNLSKITEDKQKSFLESELLKDYKHLLETLFIEGKYLLSEKEEKILSLKSKVAYSNWESLTQEFLNKSESEVIDPKTEELSVKSFNEIQGILLSKDDSIRNRASEEFDRIVTKFEDVAEAEINSLLENKKIDDELRKMPRPDFDRHLDDDIDSEVVDTLIKVISDNFNIARRFYTLKARLLGKNKFLYNDRNVEYSSADKTYTYSESVELVKKVFSNLDEEFIDIFNGFLENGQIDVFPRKGKRGGAFCTDFLISLPTFIMLNHTGNLKDVLTLAHEVGHGINHQMMKKSQNALNFGTPKSTAEVASTFMEDFVLQELLKEADDELRLGLLISKLQGDITTIFRQAACYKFEQEIHKKFREIGYLSKKDIEDLFEDNMFAYLGEAFEKSDSMRKGWIYWPHIRDFFYVYSYSSGLLISKFMQKKLKEDKSFITHIKEFLSSGTSDSPKNIFLKMEINISEEKFWKDGLSEINELLDEVETLAKKLGKI